MRLFTTIVLGCALGLAMASTAFAQGTRRSLEIQPVARQNGMGADGLAIADGVGAKCSVDLAGLHRVPAALLNVGVELQKLGPSVTFVNEDQRSPLSRNVKAGLAWEGYSQQGFKALLAGDFDQSLVTDAFWQ